jgi:hypothetical protein
MNGMIVPGRLDVRDISMHDRWDIAAEVSAFDRSPDRAASRLAHICNPAVVAARGPMLCSRFVMTRSGGVNEGADVAMMSAEGAVRPTPSGPMEEQCRPGVRD